MTTGLLFGTFDRVHIGHVWLIQSAFARMKRVYGGDVQLCIVVGRDSTVRGAKGVAPLQGEEVRMAALKALFPECRVVLGHRTQRMYWVRHVRPAIVFLGYDQVHFVDTLLAELHRMRSAGYANVFRIVRLRPFEQCTYKSSLLVLPRQLLRGVVVHGEKLGRTIGYPTANIALSKGAQQMIRAERFAGVYASRVLFKGKVYLGATVVGARTLRGVPLVETHIIGFAGNCYGAVITFSIEKKLRDFRVYTSNDALVRDIQLDIDAVKDFFKSTH